MRRHPRSGEEIGSRHHPGRGLAPGLAGAGPSVWLAAVATAVLAVWAPSPRAESDAIPPDPARWIASDAVLSLEVPRPEVLIDRLSEPRIQDYLRVLPAYRKFLEGPAFSQIRAVAGLIAGRLDTTWDRGLRNLTGGGILAAVEAEAGKEPRIFLVITPRDAGQLERASRVILEMVRGDAARKKKPEPVKTVAHRGVTVYAAAGPKGGAYAVVAGRLVLSNSADNLKRLLDRAVAARTKAGAGSSTAVGSTLADQPEWKRQRDRLGRDAMIWGLVRLDRLRQVDPQRFTIKEKGDTGVVLLFGSWYEALRKAPWVAANLRWTDSELAARVELPAPPGGYPGPVKGYIPGAGQGTAPPLNPPGTIASLSLWRDWATIWESRAELFAPEVVQGLAQFDTFAGQFFGAREFGPDVLGAFDPHWRLIIAEQDYQALKPAPDVKLPAFALVAELESADGDFAQRLKVAFQSFMGLVNIGSAQQKAPLLELGSEEVEGVTIATTRYMIPRSSSAPSVTPHLRYNFSPSAAQFGKCFILSSSTHLARALVKELKSAGGDRKIEGGASATLSVDADGPELARLLERNRPRLVMQTMLKQGETKSKAEERVDLGLALLRYLGHGRLLIRDGAEATRLELSLQLAKAAERQSRP
ncbi:MAG TPA: hypothetical protein VFF52_10080 [Isosphaeraceae bacterium]|nr:hypothetical protein [Isosphaeraceae bacterium]